MSYHTKIIFRQLHFKQPAQTSRGVYATRRLWQVLLTSDEHPDKWGIGECAPLPDLSCDALPNYEEVLRAACCALESKGDLPLEMLRPYPSILFGLETALRHFGVGSFRLWDTSFSRGEAGIPINGLIWMSDYDTMLQQIEAKMHEGFRCMKLKIGAIHFEKELALLRHIRRHYSASEIELRVDANGAFSPDDAKTKLKQLAELELHSIEQPIRAGQWETMAQLTKYTPLPIALDEELIGCHDPQKKRALLETIRPQYIILKPSLHGGMSGSQEWIDEAERLGIGWWITSALESNVGLNAIAQWCATCGNPLPQGLGTGALFTDNIEMPLVVKKDCLWYLPQTNTMYDSADLNQFFTEWFNTSPVLTVQTSGSTGTPKQLAVRKEQMKASARMTCSFLHLKPGDKGLLCMPLQYIGAKMMVVRALVAELDLVVATPSGHPLADIDCTVQFAAMTPQQVYNSLQVAEEKERLAQIETLIIGGGRIDPTLESAIRGLPNNVYSTYGMTETLSHIALRRLNGEEASSYYTPFPSVAISLSAEGTLVIEAPLVCDEVLITNDLAEMTPDGRFVILGRKDNVINSGGIKIQIEQVEEKLRPMIPFDYAITSVPDPKFGEAVVLLLSQKIDTKVLSDRMTKIIPTYQRPQHIQIVKNIPTTENGKTDRTGCRDLANRLLC